MRTFSPLPLLGPIQTTILSGEGFDALKAVSGVRARLLEEQGGVCAYCERKLTKPKTKTKIEHMHPRSGTQAAWGPECDERSGAATHLASVTAWPNLLLCCMGGDGDVTRPRSCDTAKANSHICAEFENPKTSRLPWIARVAPDGRLIAHLAAPTGAQHVIDVVLALNEASLVEARLERWDELRLGYKKYKEQQGRANKRSLTANEKRAFAERLRADATRSGRAFRSVALSFADSIEP